MRLIDRAGPLLVALGLVGLGLIALTFNHVLDGLFPVPDAGPPWPWIEGTQLLILGLLMAWPRTARVAALIVALIPGAVNLMVRAPALAADAGNVVAWVPTMQVLGIASAALLIALPDRRWVAIFARIAIGLMLILFGAVHLIYPTAITGLIPEGFPARDLWPYATGPVQIAAGLALATGLRTAQVGAAVAVMFLSWLPLVHAPRLLAAPTSREEWTFALIALTLAGAVAIAGRADTLSGRRF